MTKRFAFLCLLLAGWTFTYSQVAIKPAVGINFTDFSKDAATGEYKSQVGWQIGGSVAFGKKIYFEPGIYYVSKSSKYESSGSSSFDVDFDQTGIRIPVSVGINLLGNEKSFVGLRAFGGASVFFLTDIKNFDTDDFNTASWGVFAGAGLDFSIVFLETSYEWSLTNVSKDLSNIDVGKSRSLFINAGVRIPL